MKAVGLRWRFALVLALPMVRKQLPSLHAQFLRFHTKSCLDVLVDFVELGIIV
jgi:hypothetical protein